MNETRNPRDRRGAVERAANYVITGDRDGNRTTRVAGQVIGKVIDKEGGKVTGRVVVAILVMLAVAGLAFVAYRLLVLDLILTLVEERG